ncbi:MAG: hypothetical protein ACRDRX_02845 [Pseudonocardiaceae bacterium]
MSSDLVIAYTTPFALVGLALLLWALLLWAFRWRRVRTQINFLYRAASEDGANQMRNKLDRGISIERQGNPGNTALQLACRQESAVARLVAFSADENLRDREGLTAAEMLTLALTEKLLNRGARCLGFMGEWRDVNQGRAVYEELKRCSPRVYNHAVVRVALKSPESRRQLLHLAIKIGIPDSAERLVDVLDGYGTEEMAVEYLNAGSKTLYNAAERWARRNNYRIRTTRGWRTVTWGKF